MSARDDNFFCKGKSEYSYLPICLIIKLSISDFGQNFGYDDLDSVKMSERGGQCADSSDGSVAPRPSGHGALVGPSAGRFRPLGMELALGSTPSSSWATHILDSSPTDTLHLRQPAANVLVRMKVAKSCRQCRLGKRRCVRSDDGTACNECRRRTIACSSAFVRRGSAVTRNLLPQSSLALLELEISHESTVGLVRLYIALIHDKPHTLFHPATLLGQASEGSLPQKILYCVLALASRYDTGLSNVQPSFSLTSIGKAFLQTQPFEADQPASRRWPLRR